MLYSIIIQICFFLRFLHEKIDLNSFVHICAIKSLTENYITDMCVKFTKNHFQNAQSQPVVSCLIILL